MLRSLALAASTLAFVLVGSAPAFASTLQFWESTQGSPGVTGNYNTGAGLTADIDFDASSAEGGSLLFGASEITIVPFGSVSLNSFTCELAGCSENIDYVFTPGNAGAGGGLILSDPDFNSKSGVFSMGFFGFDALGVSGGIQLSGCNYTDANATERTCDPFTLAQVVPEPGTGLLVGGGLLLLGGPLRRRR